MWGGLPATVRRVEDVGRHRIVRAEVAGREVNAILPEGAPVPAGAARSSSIPRIRSSTAMTGACAPRRAWGGPPDGKDRQPEGLVPGPAGAVLVAFSAVVPLMTVVKLYSVQDTFGDNEFFWAASSGSTR